MAVNRRPCSKCLLNRQEKFFKSERANVCLPCQRKGRQKSSRALRVSKTYGLTQEEHDALLAAQGGVCAICKGGRSYNLDVDHDHMTGMVRGLLCRRCNRQLLTAARSSIEMLHNAALYLQRPPALDIIGERKVPS